MGCDDHEEASLKKKDDHEEEQHDIVIVGGGICGLATALALHRKGIKSLVLEKSPTLRASGAAIGIYLNGWCALDQLCVGEELRALAAPLEKIHDVWFRKNEAISMPCSEEFRCLRRSDLIEALAKDLPADSVRLGCQIVAVEIDSVASFPVLRTGDGSVIKAKVLIGCDGSNSLISKSLGLEAPRVSQHRSVRAFTNYPEGHKFGNYFAQIYDEGIVFGRVPIDDKLVHWFVGHRYFPEENKDEKDPKHIKELTLKLLDKFPAEVIEMVECCDTDSLSIYQVRYRSPWNLLLSNFCSGTTAVAGDALHVMGPFLGQGGCASLEDAVVLARCLAPEMAKPGSRDWQLRKRVEIAFEKYARERRLRVLRLSLQTYLVGLIMLTPNNVKKLVIIALLLAFFGNPRSLSHARFNCGCL